MTMSESTVFPILTSTIIENVSQLENNGTTGLVDYDASDIGFITMMASFTIIGVPSNILLVIVFCQRQKRYNGTNNLFALSLAVTDAIICGVTVPAQTFGMLGMIRTDFGCGISVFIGYMTVSFQVILMLGVCIERYCAVCRPFQRWNIKHVTVFITAAAIYSGSISTIAFPIAVFDATASYFCQRRASLAKSVMDLLNACSWFAIVIIMAVLYIITILEICKRTRKRKLQNTSGSNRNGAVKRNSISETQITSLALVSGTADALFTIARSQSFVVVDLALFAQTGFTTIKMSDSRTRSSRRHHPTHRITLLFVAITVILVLSWVPYWWTIWKTTYLIVRNLVYLNSCTNFLVFATNPTLRHEMAQVVKRFLYCHIRKS